MFFPYFSLHIYLRHKAQIQNINEQFSCHIIDNRCCSACLFVDVFKNSKLHKFSACEELYYVL